MLSLQYRSRYPIANEEIEIREVKRGWRSNLGLMDSRVGASSPVLIVGKSHLTPGSEKLFGECVLLIVCL